MSKSSYPVVFERYIKGTGINTSWGFLKVF